MDEFFLCHVLKGVEQEVVASFDRTGIPTVVMECGAAPVEPVCQSADAFLRHVVDFIEIIDDQVLDFVYFVRHFLVKRPFLFAFSVICRIFPVEDGIVVAENIADTAAVQCAGTILDHIIINVDGDRFRKSDVSDDAVKTDAGPMAEDCVCRDGCRYLIKRQMLFPGDHFRVVDSLSAAHSYDALKMRQLLDVFEDFIIFESFYKMNNAIFIELVFKEIPDIFHCDDKIWPLYDVFEFAYQVAAEDCSEHVLCHFLHPSNILNGIYKLYL